MSKLYFLVFLAIITVSLGCGIPENPKSLHTEVLPKPEEEQKEVTAENSERVIRQDTPPDVAEAESKDSKEQDIGALKEAEQKAEEETEKLNKKVSDEIKDEIVKIAGHHQYVENIQPAGKTIGKINGLIKIYSG